MGSTVGFDGQDIDDGSWVLGSESQDPDCVSFRSYEKSIINHILQSLVIAHRLYFADRNVAILFVGALFLLAAFPTKSEAQIITRNVFPSIQFERPVRVTNDGVNDWLYVVEQSGLIKVMPNDTQETEAGIFLDIRDKVFFDIDVSLEIGLLGLAFHPQYQSNGYFYVYHLAEEPYRAVLSRYERDASDPTKADPGSEVVLLEIDREFYYHHGGDLAFGPDGYLYLSLGDGHPSNDGLNNAQNLTTLLGSILRIDVDHQENGKNYAIPMDNPFAGNTEGYREEIYAYGLRNPWRFSIDAETGDIWVGNVGELDYEEVNLIRPGGNYGWPLEAGGVCRKGGCVMDDYTVAVWSYSREPTSEIHQRGNVCVTGGFVYRGSAIPELVGTYVYSDCSSGIVWGLKYDGTNPAVNETIYETGRFVPAFGEDINRELYLVRYYEGRVDRLMLESDTTTVSEPQITATGFELDGPNPFRTATAVKVSVEEATALNLRLYNTLGQEVSVLFDGTLPRQTTRTFSIDAAFLPAGVYFCRLELAGQVSTHKLVVLK